CNGTGKVNRITKSLFGDLKTEVVCEKCAGLGFENVEKCPACSGEGRIEKESIVSVEIPAGVIDGQILKLTGYGNAGRRGEQAGDLNCLIEEIKHENFQREEENLIYDLEISETEAENGTDVTVPILNGKIKLKIPAGTESGKLLRITGRGLAKLNSTDKGDMLVRISYN
ncbi:MAG: molecular chaperone DnaJ, partial [Candidatus Cloacimonetes bacterium]|nr:molecular chaperone DnaJ [Candidatus Cloacimonadota bacterium]